MTACRLAFWQLATRAIERGLLTRQEAHIVARTGTRKSWAMCSHLARLRLILADRAQVARNG